MIKFDTINQNKKIPRYIHQINLSGCNELINPMNKTKNKHNSRNSELAENINNIRKFNKDWSYICWNEKEIYDLCLQYNDICANIFKAFCDHNKQILAKYIILHSFGGIYLDMDCTALKSFNTIPQLDSKDIILSYTNSGGFVDFPNILLKNLILEGTLMHLLNTSTIVSTPNNIYIEEIIKNILNKHRKIHEAKLVTKILTKYKNNPNVLLLDHRYFDSCHELDSCCLISKEAIVNHKHNYLLLNTRIARLLGCGFHLKEIYDCIMSCTFILAMLLIFIFGLWLAVYG